MNKWLDRYIFNIKILFIGGGILGVMVFLALFGFECLNVTNDDWILMGDHDFIQAYLGWQFYRSSDSWLRITNWVYNHDISIIYTDGLPLAMIFFKVFAKVLPETFQYFGVITCIGFLLQGGLTALLVKDWINSWEGIVAAVIFSCMNPVMLYRCFAHFSLSMHWLILAAFCLWKYKERLGRKAYFLWIVLFLIGGMTHLYFIPILALVYMGEVLHDVLVYKKRNVLKWIGTLAISAVLCIGYGVMFGVFGNELSIAAPEWGFYNLSESNANLNTFINPIWCSRIFPSLGNCYTNQFNEGFAYLGLGAIVLFVLGGISYFFRDRKQKAVLGKREKCAVAFCAVVSIVVAIGFKWCWGTRELFVIPIPESIKGILATFRSIGRYIWPAYYIILICILVLFSSYFYKQHRWVGQLIFLLLICLQRFDCDKLYEYRYNSAKSLDEYESVMIAPEWEEIAKKNEVIVMYPEFASSDKMYISMTKYAIENSMKLTSAILAHESNLLAEEAELRYRELLNGEVMDNAIYWFINEEVMLTVSDVLHCEVIDGYCVGWKNAK